MSAPRFLADENLEWALIAAVRRNEPAIEFLTSQQAGLSHADDLSILAYAHDHGLIIVTHDVTTMIDYARQRIESGAGTSGLFLVPQSARPRDIVETIILVWTASDSSEWRDRIVFLPI